MLSPRDYLHARNSTTTSRVVKRIPQASRKKLTRSQILVYTPGMAAGVEYVPVWVSFFDDPKTVAFKDALQVSTADIYPIRLWKYCWIFYPDGVVPGGADEIERACAWQGERGVLAAALQRIGFVDGDGCTVHQWMQYTGRLRANFERARLFRRNIREEYRKNIDGPGVRAVIRMAKIWQSPSRQLKARTIAELFRLGAKEKELIAAARAEGARDMTFYEWADQRRAAIPPARRLVEIPS